MTKKTCTQCDNTKPITAFNKSGKSKHKHGVQAWCRDCQKAHYRKTRIQHMANVKRRQRMLQKRVTQYKKAQICGRCGFSDWRALDFHHRDPQNKKANLAHIGLHKGWAWERIVEEIEKCEIICANCHRIEHASVG